jgi:hypothetical protein
VKRQVDSAKEVGEPLGPSPCIGHRTRVTARPYIVNPDGSRLRRGERSGRLAAAGMPGQ